MSDPISLRNIPPEVLKLAQRLSIQTGLSINDIFRLALASGLLVEATKVAPEPDGTFAGWEGPLLAKALRRHLTSPIDLLLEYGQHPYQVTIKRNNGERSFKRPRKIAPSVTQEKSQLLEHSIGDDLDTLDFGGSFSETLEAHEQFHEDNSCKTRTK